MRVTEKRTLIAGLVLPIFETKAPLILFVKTGKDLGFLRVLFGRNVSLLFLLFP